MAKKKTQYIGEKEVKSIAGDTVTLKDGSTMVLTDKQLTYIITETPHDLTQMRSLVASKVAQEMLAVIEEHDIRFGDVDYIIQVFVDSFNRGFNIALGKAFGTYEQGKDSSYFKEDIRVSDVKRLLEE